MNGFEQNLGQIVSQVLLIFGALFPIVNPLGTAPIFLTLTGDLPESARCMLARQVALNGFMLLLGSIFIGNYILAFFGISIPVVQVGGGLVVLSTGWKLLQSSGDNQSQRRHSTPAEAEKRAFYPLTLPLTVGPGTISVAITVGANRAQGAAAATSLIALLIGSTLIAVSIWLSYRFAERIARALGETTMNVILRLSSFILVCIGVQIVWNGYTALLKTVH
jgi:multiple antibiotic resistance protein